jgi:hypothetical protein
MVRHYHLLDHLVELSTPVVIETLQLRRWCDRRQSSIICGTKSSAALWLESRRTKLSYTGWPPRAIFDSFLHLNTGVNNGVLPGAASQVIGEPWSELMMITEMLDIRPFKYSTDNKRRV